MRPWLYNFKFVFAIEENHNIQIQHSKPSKPIDLEKRDIPNFNIWGIKKENQPLVVGPI